MTTGERIGGDPPSGRAVSVVVPTFDRLEYVGPTLESVFAQTWNDWELIIADDGSGDELRSYLRTLQNRPRVKVVWLAHRGIPTAVRNAAIQEATGRYVAFLDSDDLWAPRKLQLQIAQLAARPECRWSYTGRAASCAICSCSLRGAHRSSE